MSGDPTTDDDSDDDSPSRATRVLPAVGGYFVRRLLILAWVVPALTAVVWLPTTYWAVELLRHFAVYWMAIGAVAAVTSLGCGKWPRAVLAAAAVAAHGLLVLPYFVQDSRDAGPLPSHGDSFTVMTCNLLVTASKPDEVARMLEERNPDVLLLQEYTPEWSRHLRPLLDRYPETRHRSQDNPFGILIASRLPMYNAEVFDVAAERQPMLSAEIVFGSRRIRVVGVHPMNPLLPSGSAMWREQFAAIATAAAEGNFPDRIVAGDFNSTPYALTFRNLLGTAGLRDSALGRGIRHTWSPVRWSPIGLPLDHILVSDSLHVLDRTEGTIPGSDHKWVMARLAPAPDKD